MFVAKPTTFLPVCPNLVYQFSVYANCMEECTTLQESNPEVATGS